MGYLFYYKIAQNPTFRDVDAMHLDAEDEDVFARIVDEFRLGADLGNGDAPGAEVARLVGQDLVGRDNVQHIQL